MGGVNSYCVPRHRNPNACKENHTSTPKVKGCKRNLSAAFNLTAMDREQAMEQLNINTATEEELMTLPGVNRSTAINIVEYRAKIDGFKKVEDLALVSGVGATKLGQIRMEICVGKKKSSKASSPSNSNQDLTSVADSKVSSSRSAYRLTYTHINVNAANVFQLMKIKGISQQLAENIVTYRDRKGSFRSLDDLVKVKGINSAVLSAIRPYLVLKNGPAVTTAVLPNGHVLNSSPPRNSQSSETASRTSHTSQVSRITEDDDLFTYGPLSQSSVRPQVPAFSFEHKGQPVVRVGSWNLEQCALDKIQNPGVREVVCMTVLENGFSIMAFQELEDTSTLQKICDELNNPTLPSVKKWKGHQGAWRCMTSPADDISQSAFYHGFLYDTSKDVDLISCRLLQPDCPQTAPSLSPPFMGLFQVRSLRFNLVSIHIRKNFENRPSSEEIGKDEIEGLFTCIEEHLIGENEMIVAGDFSMPPDATGFQVFQSHHLCNSIPVNSFTDISMTNLNGSYCHDNIWLSQHCQVFTGNRGVVRDGLTSPWIPNGWSWGGTASSHCPVWIELFTNKTTERNGLTSDLGRTMDSSGLTSDLEGISFTVKHLISEM